MRVLQLISSGGMYGAEAVVLNLARYLDATGHHSVLGVFANGDHQLHHAALSHQLESHLLPCAGQCDIRMPARLRQLVREHRIDVVHAHGYKADVYTYFALRNAGVPLVSTCHTWLDTDFKVKVYGMLDRLVLRGFDAIAVVSAELQTMLLAGNIAATKVRVISNGIDLRPFQQAAARAAANPATGGPFRIGLVGRLSPEKGIDLFLRAAALVLAQQPNTHFLVAGSGPERDSLEALAGQLGVAPQVQFLGRVENMPELLASLDLVVSASRQEGLPIAILESMASSRPIVATTVGQVADVLAQGAGLLVPPEDVEALAQAVLTLIAQPALRRSYAEQAANRVATHFSPERMAAEYLDLYQAAQSSK